MHMKTPEPEQPQEKKGSFEALKVNTDRLPIQNKIDQLDGSLNDLMQRWPFEKQANPDITRQALDAHQEQEHLQQQLITMLALQNLQHQMG